MKPGTNTRASTVRDRTCRVSTPGPAGQHGDDDQRVGIDRERSVQKIQHVQASRSDVPCLHPEALGEMTAAF